MPLTCRRHWLLVQVGLMRNGHLLAEGPPDALMTQHSATVSRTVTDAQRNEGVKTLPLQGNRLIKISMGETV